MRTPFRHAATVSFLLVLMQFSAEAVGAGEAPASRPVDVALSIPGRIEPGERASAQLVLTNNTAAVAVCKVAWSMQADGEMFSETPPDPVFGRDRAGHAQLDRA